MWDFVNPFFVIFCVEITSKLSLNRGFERRNLEGFHPYKPLNKDFSHFYFSENLTPLRHKW